MPNNFKHKRNNESNSLLCPKEKIIVLGIDDSKCGFVLLWHALLLVPPYILVTHILPVYTAVPRYLRLLLLKSPFVCFYFC